MGRRVVYSEKELSHTQVNYIHRDPLNKLMVPCSGSEIIHLACNPKIHFGLHKACH